MFSKLTSSVSVGIFITVLCTKCIAGVFIANNESIAFFGDSITQQGANLSTGYVRLVLVGLEANNIKTVPIFAGIGGSTSVSMLSRLKKDVLSTNPRFMTLSCGINDVWQGGSFDKYKENVTKIVAQTQAAGIHVIIMTTTMLTEDPAHINNLKLKEYNDFLRRLAKDKQCILADINTAMCQALLAINAKKIKSVSGNYFSYDGVHMNVFGNQLIAETLLTALGLDSKQIEKAKASWLDITGSCEVISNTSLTIRQYNQIRDMAAKQNMTAKDFMDKEFTKFVDTVLTKK